MILKGATARLRFEKRPMPERSQRAILSSSPRMRGAASTGQAPMNQRSGSPSVARGRPEPDAWLTPIGRALRERGRRRRGSIPRRISRARHQAGSPAHDKPQRQRIEPVLIEDAAERVLTSPGEPARPCAIIDPASISSLTKCTVRPDAHTASSLRVRMQAPEEQAKARMDVELPRRTIPAPKEAGGPAHEAGIATASAALLAPTSAPRRCLAAFERLVIDFGRFDPGVSGGPSQKRPPCSSRSTIFRRKPARAPPR